MIIDHQPFPWSVWLQYPDEHLGWHASDYSKWQRDTYKRLLEVVAHEDICRDPFTGTGCYFCIRVRREDDAVLIKLMYEGVHDGKAA